MKTNRSPVKLLVVDSSLRWALAEPDMSNGNANYKEAFQSVHGIKLKGKYKVFIVPSEVEGIADDFGYTIKDKTKDFTWIQVI